jgi:SAM-dependent methyltransferase
VVVAGGGLLPAGAAAPAFLGPVAEAFRDSLRTFGTASRGVLWNSPDEQRLRFEVLYGIVDPEDERRGFVANDFGCGYGAMFDFLAGQSGFERGRYYGYDLCPDMVAAARARIADDRATFFHAAVPTHQADYGFASGTFNLKLGADPVAWWSYVKGALVDLWGRSLRGMAFNMLSAYTGGSDRDFFYADPRQVLDFCLRELAPRVTLVHDYPLREFTIWVRR